MRMILKETVAVKNVLAAGLLAAMIAFGAAASQAASKVVVGYYYPAGTSSYTYTTIRYDCLTHIAHAFIEPTSSGALSIPGGFLYPQLNQRAHDQGVKVVISIGGYGAANTAAFVAMAADTAARHKFVDNLKNFCVTNKYDGADLDWEYPAAGDKANFTALVHELRAAFNTVTPALTLSAATSAGGSAGFDLAAVTADFDWIGVMTYDFFGTWTSHAGPNSPLYQGSATDQGWIDQSVAFFAGRGVPAAKTLIGIPFYGWQYSVSTLYGSPTTGARQLYYASLIGNLSSGWTRTWDAATRTPYMTGAGKMISYDDSQSVAEKCEYIKSKNLGGAIIWAIGQDYIYPAQPLLETVGERLFNVTSVAAGGGDRAQTPDGFALAQNYPNPFNPSTRIGFTLPERAHVKLAIVNVLGQTVATLVDGEMTEGAHDVEWNAAGYPSGVYYCRITAAGSSRVIAMVLQK